MPQDGRAVPECRGDLAFSRCHFHAAARWLNSPKELTNPEKQARSPAQAISTGTGTGTGNANFMELFCCPPIFLTSAGFFVSTAVAPAAIASLGVASNR